MTKPMLIMLASPAPGCGKSEVAKHLQSAHGFAILRFAAPLKDMAKSLYASLGHTPDGCQRLVDGDLKETVVEGLGVTSRHVMQSLGTEFGRKSIHVDVWARITAQRATKLLAAGINVVVDDMRFPNELAALQAIGGIPVAVIRPGVVLTTAHESEGALDLGEMWCLHNEGTVADLQSRVDAMVSTLR